MIFKDKKKSDEIVKKIRLLISDNDGTLTPGQTYYSNEGEELKAYHHRDGRGIHLLMEHNIMFGIITGEASQIVMKRGEKLKVNFVKLGVLDKVSSLKEIMTEFQLSIDEIAYIGDDTNDLEIMRKVGLSFAVSDAHADILEVSDVVCSNLGGLGAVREVTDYIITSRY